MEYLISFVKSKFLFFYIFNNIMYIYLEIILISVVFLMLFFLIKLYFLLNINVKFVFFSKILKNIIYRYKD